MAGLMTLKSFAEGGCEVKDNKILVCVKSIGARKKCRWRDLGADKTGAAGLSSASSTD